MCCAGTDIKNSTNRVFGLLIAVARNPSPAWHLSVEHQFYFPIRWAALAQDCEQKQRNAREKASIIPTRDALGELGNNLDFSEDIYHWSQEAFVGATPRVELCCYALEKMDNSPNGTHVFLLGSIIFPNRIKDIAYGME